MWVKTDNSMFTTEVSGARVPLKVGILGSGKIGTDLLLKVMRSPFLECVMFAGRNENSEGIQFAQKLNVPVSTDSISAFLDPNLLCDIVFDATSAVHHIKHAKVFKELGILAIDMTPSMIGQSIVPAIEFPEFDIYDNINMISCGGQSSIPILYAMTNNAKFIQNIKLNSIASSESIGPGTLANIDEYYNNTKYGISKYTGFDNIKVDLSVDKSSVPKKMKNVIILEAETIRYNSMEIEIREMETRVKNYVPGFNVECIRSIKGLGCMVEVTVEGAGDYLPTYAGNLDIINCAAIAVAEKYAQYCYSLKGSVVEELTN